jgi:hypothetical protein
MVKNPKILPTFFLPFVVNLLAPGVLSVSKIRLNLVMFFFNRSGFY